MYCVKCGVELADSEEKCPLCKTPVYYPGRVAENKPYPEFSRPETVNPRGIYFIASFVCLIAAVISFVCDLNLNMTVTWSGYVLGAIAVAYIVLILPGWFRKYNPAIFVPVSFLAAALYLFYINFELGGDWYFTLALPITAATALIVSSVTILSYYLKGGYLYIYGGAFIGTGLFMPIMEMLANITLNSAYTLRWSFYPLIAFSLVGIMLIVIAIVKPLRESLCRIFAI